MENNTDYSFANALLLPGEYVVHRCKPGKGRLLSAQDVVMIPFSLVWCGFALFWEYTALQTAAPMALFGIPFVLVGLYLVVGRFFHTAWLRSHTAYVITNRRVLRKQNNKVDMVEASNLPPMQLTTYADGSGTITFGQENYVYRRGRRRYSPHSVLSLDNIPDVTKVQQHIAAMEK